MRPVTLTLCVSILLIPALPGVYADEEASAHYVLPSHGATVCPTGLSNAPTTCIGGAIVKSPSGREYTDASAKVIDDNFGENVAYTICVGDDDNTQGCTPGNFVCGAGSIATDQSEVQHSHVNVFILAIYIPENGAEPCIATSGTVDVTFIA